MFAGIEMTAVHIRDVKDPKNDYPRAIFTAAAIALVMFILGSLAIAALVPKVKISLVAGVMEAYSTATSSLGISWLLPVAMFLILGGAVAQLITWIAGPSKGIMRAARNGCLPPVFQKMNKHNMPTTILILQGIIVTILSFVFVMMPDVSASFWILTALTAQLYLIMYVMMFASAIKLRYSQPKVKPTFRIPGGNIGLWIIAGVGILASVSGILLGFLPPSQEQTGSLEFYEGFLGIGILLVIAIPLVIYNFRKKSWISRKNY